MNVNYACWQQCFSELFVNKIEFCIVYDTIPGGIPLHAFLANPSTNWSVVKYCIKQLKTVFGLTCFYFPLLNLKLVKFFWMLLT